MTCEEIAAAILALEAENTALDAQILADDAAVTAAAAESDAAYAAYSAALTTYQNDVDQKSANSGQITMYQSMQAMQGC